MDDYGLTSSYHAVITKSIQDQLSDFKAHSANYDGDGGDISVEGEFTTGTLDEEDAAWWESWRKRLRTESGYVRLGKKVGVKGRKRRKLVKEEGPDEDMDKDGPLELDGIEVYENTERDDMRILIKVCFPRFAILF